MAQRRQRSRPSWSSKDVSDPESSSSGPRPSIPALRWTNVLPLPASLDRSMPPRAKLEITAHLTQPAVQAPCCVRSWLDSSPAGLAEKQSPKVCKKYDVYIGRLATCSVYCIFSKEKSKASKQASNDSPPNFATKYSLESPRRDLSDLHASFGREEPNLKMG